MQFFKTFLAQGAQTIVKVQRMGRRQFAGIENLGFCPRTGFRLRKGRSPLPVSTLLACPQGADKSVGFNGLVFIRHLSSQWQSLENAGLQYKI
eukprot:s1502_g9.t1